MTEAGGSDDRGFTLRQSVWIRVSPERVWRSLTSREDLVRWFASDLTGDVRVGGPVEFLFASCDARIAGRWLELDPGRRVSFAFDASRVTFDLEPQRDGTLVRLTDEGLPPDLERVAGQSEGWSAYLCNLKVVLETGRDLRADQPPGTILPR